MEHISFNFQILPILLGLLGIAFLLFIRKRVPKDSFLKSFWWSGMFLFGFYFLLMLSTTIYDVYIRMEYDSYDIDKNGYIDDFERTGNYFEVQKRLVNDTARNLAYMTGAVLSIIISFFVFIISLIHIFFKRRKRIKESIA